MKVYIIEAYYTKYYFYNTILIAYISLCHTELHILLYNETKETFPDKRNNKKTYIKKMQIKFLNEILGKLAAKYFTFLFYMQIGHCWTICKP